MSEFNKHTCTGESELWKRHGTNEKYMYRILAEWTVGCLKRNAATWIEKTPSHLLCCTDAIRLRYPRARFVLMTRDPRDNLVSLLKRFESKDRKKGAPRNTSVARWTGLLAHYAAAAERTDDLPGSVVRRVRLEDLQADCANELGGVLRWLKLDYNASLHCSGSFFSSSGLFSVVHTLQIHPFTAWSAASAMASGSRPLSNARCVASAAPMISRSSFQAPSATPRAVLRLL